MDLIYNYILMIPFTVMCFWFVKFAFDSKKDIHSPYHCLAIIIAIAIYDLVVSQSFVDSTASEFYYLHFFDSFVSPMVMPFTYYYLRSITVRSHIKAWEWIYLVPPVVIGIVDVVTGVMMGQGEVLAHHYPDVMTHAGCTLTGSSLLWWHVFNYYTFYDFVVLAELLVMGSVMVYDLYHYRQRIENYYANVDDKCFTNVHNLLVFSLFLVLLNILLTLLHRAWFANHGMMACLFSIVESGLECAICYNAFHIRFSVRNLEEEHVPDSNDDVADETESKPEEDYQEVLKILTAWITRADKPYLAEGLTIESVASDTGLHRRIISAYLNNVMHVNFNTWINTYRIQEAKRLLLAPEKHTTFYIASRVGMTDAASFSRLFKKLEGVTPSEYRRTHSA